MKNTIVALLYLVAMPFLVNGQQRLVNEVKKEISGLTLTVDSYKNSLKKIKPGKSVASLALGSKHMYEFLDYNKDVEFYDVAWTNDPQVIRQNPRVIAINSALEVDLTGQICADRRPGT